MKEQHTKSKKRVVYYLLLAACVLILAAATVLTVYFVTNGNNVIDNPNTPDNPVTPDNPDNPDDPNKPTGGEAAVFVAPVNASYTAEYNTIYANETLGWFYRHYALDFAADEGEKVCAMTDGTVSEVSLSQETGNYILIDHGDGLVSCYRFVEPKKGLKAGDKVKAGDEIGTVAASYGSESKDGAHLHFEVTKNGVCVDPTTYIDAVLSEK